MVDVKNLYEILDVPCNASFEDIKLAYKKLARIYHPDINKTKDAEIKFKLLNNAYNILSDAEKKKNYDELLKFSDAKKGESPAVVNFHEKKSEFVKKNKPNKNSIIKEVKITEKEQNQGTTRTVNILNTQKCPKCMGKKIFNGASCAFCKGIGEKKEFKQIEINIEKNVKEGELVYVGKVNSSALFDRELYLKILIEPEKKLYFEGDNVFAEVEIPLYDAVLGCEKEINIPHFGLFKFQIPKGVQNGDKVELKINEIEGKFFAVVKISTPKNLTKEEEKLYKKIKELNG